MTDPPQTLADLVARAHALAAGSARVVLGISGEPGSGKSTLAQALVRALEQDPPEGHGRTWVALVPMDGFHLADAELARLGLAAHKGAPETFDDAGYAALLARIAADGADTVYAPAFDRGLDQPVAGSIPVTPATRLVVTEGNYLLLAEGCWPRARAHVGQVWVCRPDRGRRLRQLQARHAAYGKDAVQARAWALGPDETNARRVAEVAHHADLVVGESLLRGLGPEGP